MVIQVAQLWHELRTHRWAASIFVACWLAAWVMTVILWQYDPAGYSVGMPPVTIFPNFLLPLALGVLVGWWRTTLGSKIRGGLLAGLAFSAVNFVVLLLWSGILIGLGKAQIDPAMAWWEGPFEALHLGLTYCVIGLVLGGAGGLGGALLSKALRSAGEASS